MHKNVSDFFEYVRNFNIDSKNITFNYFAVRRGKNFYLTNARIFYSNLDIVQKESHFQSENIRAGLYSMQGMGIEPAELVSQALTGVISTPHGDLIFDPEGSGEYKFNFDKFHSEGLKNQYRLNVLSISGLDCGGIAQQPDMDWELKSNDTPFNDVLDLLSSYRIGPDINKNSKIEVISYNVIDIDSRSFIAEGIGNVSVRLFSNLDREKATLGYKVVAKGEALERGKIQGKDMIWENIGGIQVGRCSIPIQPGGVLQCFAGYDGVVYHFYWIVDAELSQNIRRLAYETFDRDLTCLLEFIEKGAGKGNARDLESGVAWLLWMLGFSAAHLGGTAKTQEAADLVVMSPMGNIAVIECTTGTLRAENKLPLLVMRSSAIRDRLVRSGNSHLKVLPVIVTSRNRSEIVADVSHAQNLGVLVLAQEDLKEAVNRTIIPTDAEELFMTAYEATQNAAAKAS